MSKKSKNNRRNRQVSDVVTRKQAAQAARGIIPPTPSQELDKTSANTPSGVFGSTVEDYDGVNGGYLRLWDGLKEAQRKAREEKDAAKTNKKKSARRYPDSVELTANQIYTDYIQKPHYNTSLNLVTGKVFQYWKIQRGVKGYCALVERLEKMGLLDARDCLNFSNVRTLNIMIRTRGLQKMIDNKVLAPVAGPVVNLDSLKGRLTLVERPKRERKQTDKRPTQAKTSGKGKNTPKAKTIDVNNLSTDDCQKLLKALMAKCGITSLSL